MLTKDEQDFVLELIDRLIDRLPETPPQVPSSSPNEEYTSWPEKFLQLAYRNAYKKVLFNVTLKSKSETQKCCEFCIKLEKPACPVKSADPWSRWGNYCNEFESKQSHILSDSDS